MFVMVLALAGLLGLSAAIGQGVVRISGGRAWRPWAPALGFCSLLVLGAQVVRLPGHAWAVAVVIGVAAVAALSSRDVRRALRTGARDVPLAVLVGALACLPFLAHGGLGVLGPGVNDDMSAHLLTAFWLRTHTGGLPVGAIGGDLILAGYPVGPHGIVAALGALGAGEVAGFAAVTLAIPVLTALAGLTWLREERGGAFLAVLVGLPYLAASYLTQGSFKETIVALVLVSVAAALHDLEADSAPGWRSGIPLGLLAAGAMYAYSFPGVLWPVGAAGLLVVGRRRIRPLGRPLLAAGATAAVAIGPSIPRLLDFARSSYAGSHAENSGNLFHALSPIEALGVWPSGDFRLTAHPLGIVAPLGVLAGAGLLWSLGWWWHRRRLAVPAAVLAGVAIWIELAVSRNVYAAAKGLAILAPVVALCLAVPLAERWRALEPGLGRALFRAASLALLLGAGLSTLLALRDAPVGLGAHGREVAGLRHSVRGQRVLFLGVDHYAQWELRGAHVYSAGLLYAPHRLGIHPQKPDGSPNDVDSFGSKDLDKVDWILAPSASYRSEPPANFRLVRTTSSYLLYRRVGATPVREPIELPGEPGAVLDCTKAPGSALAARPFTAAVLPTPMEEPAEAWQGTPTAPGRSATLRVTVPAGRYDVSLEYSSRLDLHVRAPGLSRRLPAQLPSLGPFWGAGTLTSTGRQFILSVTAEPPGAGARLLGAAPPAPIGGTAGVVLGRLALTRHGAREHLVPIKSACGRWIDWYAPAGAA